MANWQATQDTLPLAKAIPSLAKINRTKLIQFPTPIEKLNHCSNKLNQEIWIKRDDLLTRFYGGNKLRKFEFILPDIPSNTKTLITFGAIGSHHGLATAIIANKFDFDSHIYLVSQPLTKHAQQNLLMLSHYGAKLELCSNIWIALLKLYYNGKVKQYFSNNNISYLIAPGATTSVSCIGFVNAIFELYHQLKDKKNNMNKIEIHIFVAVGSCGTAAGLLLGSVLCNMYNDNFNALIHGIPVLRKLLTKKRRILKKAQGILEEMRKYDNGKKLPNWKDIKEILEKRLIIDHSFVGNGYGFISKDCMNAIHLGNQDGIKLDGTYTGKAFEGMIDFCKNQKTQSIDSQKKQMIIFWQTLSSVNFEDILKSADYKKLPQEFHQFFDGTVKMTQIGDKPQRKFKIRSVLFVVVVALFAVLIYHFYFN